MRRAFAPSLTFALAVALAPSAARSNGKFPAADQLVIDPGEPAHLVLRTTFGLVTSRDAGAGWDWICETAVGYVDIEPPIAVTAGGTLFAGLLDGVVRAGAGDCVWSKAAGTRGKLIADVSAVAAVPGRAVAISYDTAADACQFWESNDGAESFTPVGPPLAAFLCLTVDVAPTDPKRVYLSGRSGGSNGTSAVAASVDQGKSWKVTPVDAATSVPPYIGAVAPDDPDVVYLRTPDEPGRVLVSENGGAGFKEILTVDGAVLGFAVSPDAKTVLVGSASFAPGGSTALWRGSPPGYAFTQISNEGVRCLSWGKAGVYACGLNAYEYLVGVSTNAGESFTKLVDLACVRGPIDCDPATTVGAACPQQWPTVSEKFNTETCGQGGEGGGGGTATTSSSGAGGAMSGATSGGAGAAGARAPDDGGCGCRLAPPPDAGARAALLVLVLALACSSRVSCARQRTGAMGQRDHLL
jgi:hypothetical protein